MCPGESVWYFTQPSFIIRCTLHPGSSCIWFILLLAGSPSFPVSSFILKTWLLPHKIMSFNGFSLVLLRLPAQRRLCQCYVACCKSPSCTMYYTLSGSGCWQPMQYCLSLLVFGNLFPPIVSYYFINFWSRLKLTEFLKQLRIYHHGWKVHGQNK